MPPDVTAGAMDFGQACAFPQYPSQIRRRQARALRLSAMALQSRTRLAMVPARSLAIELGAREFEDLGDSSRAMIAATSSASGSRAEASAAASARARVDAVAGGFLVTAGRAFGRGEPAAKAEAEADAGAEAAALSDATAPAAAAMPGRAARPSLALSTRAMPSGCELASGSSRRPSTGCAEAAGACIGIGSVDADAAPGEGACAGYALGGALPMATTSVEPELSLLVATISAATPAMLKVASAIRPFVADDVLDVRRRGAFCSSAESRRIGRSAAAAVPCASDAESRLGRDDVPGDFASPGVGSMTDNVSSLWPLGHLGPQWMRHCVCQQF